jgi:hypothetical protein
LPSFTVWRTATRHRSCRFGRCSAASASSGASDCASSADPVTPGSKGDCSLGHPFHPLFIPHDNENRGVATRIDQERNPQVSGAFQRSPHVTESARLNLSWWRHRSTSPWDYLRPALIVAEHCHGRMAPDRYRVWDTRQARKDGPAVGSCLDGFASRWCRPHRNRAGPHPLR